MTKNKMTLADELRALADTFQDNEDPVDPFFAAEQIRRAAAALEEKDKALRGVLPHARGWCGVLRLLYGHHSQASAAADAAYKVAKDALRAGEAS